LTVGGTLIGEAFNNEIFALMGASSVVSILLLTKIFGRMELNLVNQHAREVLKRILRGRPVGTRETHIHLSGSIQWTELLDAVVSNQAALGLHAVKLDINAASINENYHAKWESGANLAEESAVWRAEMPITLGDHCIGRLGVIGNRSGQPIWKKVCALTELVQAFNNRLADEWLGVQQVERTGANPLLVPES
jgi:hypothetical protein